MVGIFTLDENFRAASGFTQQNYFHNIMLIAFQHENINYTSH